MFPWGWTSCHVQLFGPRNPEEDFRPPIPSGFHPGRMPPNKLYLQILIQFKSTIRVNKYPLCESVIRFVQKFDFMTFGHNSFCSIACNSSSVYPALLKCAWKVFCLGGHSLRPVLWKGLDRLWMNVWNVQRRFHNSHLGGGCVKTYRLCLGREGL